MRINPGLQVLSLMEGVVQIGTGQRARWLTGLSAAEKRFVFSLCENGLPTPPTLPQSPEQHRRSEILTVLAPVLLDSPAPREPAATVGARLLPDARRWSAAYQMDATEVLERRSAARVAIYGCGRTGQLLAHILAGAGVHGLLLIDPGTMEAQDLGAGTTGIAAVGSGRAHATARALRPLHRQLQVAETESRDPGSAALDMAVVISDGVLPPLASLPEDDAVLPVLFTDSGLHLGPLCLPGVSMCAPCVWEQCDPTLRMLGEAAASARDQALRPETSLAALAAGLAAVQVLMVLDRINIPSCAGSMFVSDMPTGSTVSVPAKARARCTCLDDVAA